MDTNRPKIKDTPPPALSGSMMTFRNIKGVNLIERVNPFFDWQNTIRNAGLWFFEKSSVTAPINICEGKDDSNNKIEGVNFASQDYLSLASHPSIKKAAKDAIDKYGVHSAGSPAVFGNTQLTLQLEKSIGDFVGAKYVALYPTGWAAGFGVIKALIRPSDHIILDQLSHSCLQEGADAATRNIYRCPHLNNDVVENQLKEIRSKDQENAVLVVTESLFSMDSDVPQIEELQNICKKYSAYLLVDAAHDLGCLGESGLGYLELQKMVGKVDVLMGSFSKTFASNGGFVATNSRSMREYLTFFSSTRTFSNAISPIQAAIVCESIRIIRSPEGRTLRERLMNNVLYMRKLLSYKGLKTKGVPSAIVPVLIGEEGVVRIMSRLLIEKGIITNAIEFPGVPKGEARIRVQVMANHTKHDIDVLVTGIDEALTEAKFLFSSIINR